MNEDLLKIIAGYFIEIDISLETLSHKKEEYIRSLPSWVLSNRRINITHILGTNNYMIEAIPDESLDEDRLDYKEIEGTRTRWGLKVSDNAIIGDGLFETGWEISDVLIQGDTLGPSQYAFRGYRDFAKGNVIPIKYSIDKAKDDAINIWNSSINSLPNTNFVGSLKEIFQKFSSLISHRAFKERKTHRYINANSKFLLPNYKNCYFERELFLNGEKRIADFILQREEGIPPMLIELENPKSKMFKTNGEFSHVANHAKSQIAEWVRFIEQNPDNSRGEMSFLQGPNKTRLVIMGRGLEFNEEMSNSRYTDTIMWTYDMLLKEAKENWSKYIAEQRKVLGIDVQGKIFD